MKSRKFLEKVWGPQGKGTAFLSGKGDGGDWHEHPVNWPASDIILPPKSADIYFCPNLFTGQGRRIDKVHRSCWLYADLDEIDPREIVLKPTVAWESSPDRYQALWKLDRKIRPEVLGDLNKRLTYLVGADKGGWDLTQVLRVPGTRNHKYEDTPTVTLMWFENFEYSPSKIRRLVKDVDPGGALTGVDDLVVPDKSTKQLLRERKIGTRAKRLLRAKNVREGERSDRLWELENLLLDDGFQPEEVFVLVRDSAWNKYRDRSDETYRLWLEIQKAARAKDALEVGERETATPVYDVAPTGWEHHDLFMQSDLEPPPWMVEGIWSDRSHGIIAGEPKGYKSLISTDLAISVASGTDFLGYYKTNITGPVLMIQEENAPWMMQSRIRKIEQSRGLLGEAEVNDDTLTITHGGDVHLELLNQSGFDLTNPSHLEALERKVQVVRPVLVIFDPLYLMLGDADENSVRDIRPILQWLLYLKVRYATGVILVHHYSKQGPVPRTGGQRLRGSGAFHGWVESALYIEKPDPENPFLIRVGREHRGQSPQGSFELEVFEGEPGDVDDFGVEVHEAQKQNDPLYKYVDQHPGVTITKAAKHFDRGTPWVTRRAEKLGLDIRRGEKVKGRNGRPPRTLHTTAEV